MKRMLALVVLIAGLIPAVSSARQVIYTNDVRAKEGATSFYMDRAGDLYPPANVELDTFYMLNVRRGPRPTVDPAHADFAVLRSLYDWKSRLPDADPDWQALLRHTAVKPTGDFASDWGQVQTALRQEVASTLSDLGRTHDVVLMIHGYNNDHKAAQGWYQQAENGLRDAAQGNGRPLAFVRMYWDGLEGRTPFFVWTRAQYNGPLVGLELRRILALVEPHVRLRVFTHSSGAFVITNALGDGSQSAERDKMPASYFDRAAGGGGYAPPTALADLRVAMLVPAQPTTSFANYFSNDERPGSEKTPMVPHRVILGLSRRDLATTKGVFGCLTLGATCMATRVAESTEQVAKDLRIQPPQLHVVAFAKPRFWPWHAHNVPAYLDDPEWDDLASSLISDAR